MVEIVQGRENFFWSASQSGRSESSTTVEAKDAIQEALSEARRWGVVNVVDAPAFTRKRILEVHFDSTTTRLPIEIAQHILEWYEHCPRMLNSIICLDEL